MEAVDAQMAVLLAGVLELGARKTTPSIWPERTDARVGSEETSETAGWYVE